MIEQASHDLPDSLMIAYFDRVNRPSITPEKKPLTLSLILFFIWFIPAVAIIIAELM